MPKIYRSMSNDQGKPKVGQESKMLGVRIPPNPHADVPVDAAGFVFPATGGMSVAPSWRLLPSFLIPKRLRHLAPDACGSNQLRCWRMGDGPFLASEVGNDLSLRPDPAEPMEHGFVEPAQSMPIARYQAALANTRDLWIQDEQ